MKGLLFKEIYSTNLQHNKRQNNKHQHLTRGVANVG